MMSNRTKRTPERQSEFLAVLSETANVSRACEIARVARRTVYEWRADDEAFRSAWDAAVEIGLSALEDEAVRRGHEGWDEPVFHKGQQCGVVRRYSDTLLIFTLKSRRREVYGERVQQDVHVTGDLAAALEAARARVRSGS